MPEMEKETSNKKKSGKQSKRGLGRGLGSLLGSESDEKAAEQKQVKAEPTQETANADKVSKLLRIIPTANIAANPFQPRTHFAAKELEELAQSIKERGILQPLVVRQLKDKSYQLIAGERRWRAAQSIGLEEVPVVVQDIEDQDSLEIAIIENIQRQNLDPIEEAQAYRRLATEFELSQKEVAAKVGKERATVANMMRLLSLPEVIQDHLSEGRLSIGHAKVLLALNDTQKQMQVAERIMSDRLNVRKTEQVVQEILDKPKSPPKKERAGLNQQLEQMREDLQKMLGTRVGLSYNEGRGKLCLHFYTDDQLDQFINKLRDD